MLLWWRPLWIDPRYSNRFVLHHLYTRALALRLILSGSDSGPFCDWEILLARYAARFEDLSVGLTTSSRITVLSCRTELSSAGICLDDNFSALE